MKSKIYLIGPTESILTKRGNRFPNIAEFLVENDLEVVYLTSNFYHAEKRFFSQSEIESESKKISYKLKVFKVLGYQSNISVKRILTNFFFSLKIFLFLLFKIRRNDLVLIPSRPVELIFFISLLKHFKKCKIFIDIQDIWPDALEIKNKFKKNIFKFYCNLYLRPSLRFYDNSFHVAPSFENWLNRYTNKKIPSSFVPLGWENKRWDTIKKSREFNTNSIDFVCVAQLQHQINVLPVLEFLLLNKQHKLTIIGEDGTGDRYSEVYNFIHQNKMTNVNIIGKVNRFEIVRLLEVMDIGVLPMITSSIPNKIFDYMAAELPIIVLGENDSATFVEKNKMGMYSSFDSVGFSKVVEQWNLENHTEFINSIRENKMKFSRNNIHKLILNILKS